MFLITIFGLAIGFYLSVDTANGYCVIELQQRVIVMEGEKDFEKIVLVGTVTELIPARGLHPHHKWLVSLQIDAVITGDIEEKTFSFAIHSPIKSGVEKGGQYVIDAARIQADKYVVKGIKPYIGSLDALHVPNNVKYDNE